MAASRYDVSAVVAHSVAANEQVCKGRYARAAEKWGRAVEAARALGAPDCLVLASAQARCYCPYALLAESPLSSLTRALSRVVQLHQAEVLFAQVSFSSGANVEEDVRFKRAMGLLLAAADVLERRRLADTLLYGKCAPHEVESVRKRLETLDYTADVTVLSAPSVGYEAYLLAARLTLYIQNQLPEAAQPVTPQCTSVLASALDLIFKPRPHEPIASAGEAMFVQQMRRCCLDSSRLNRRDRERLLGALGELEASGLMARRGLERALQANDSRVKEAAAKARADADARGLRSCTRCGAQEVHVAQFKRCAACQDKRALYCSKECQRTAWPAHKAACKAARQAAAGAAADA